VVHSAHVRVKVEVEELVREVAEELGYSAFTVRNVAILYGLAHILTVGRLPESDAEFLEILEKVSKLVGRPTPVERESRYARYVRRARKLELRWF